MNGKNTKKSDTLQEKRMQLFKIAGKARILKEEMLKKALENEKLFMFLQTRPLNFYIRRIYNLQDVEINSFSDWKKKGYTVKRGEHGHLFFGQPIDRKTVNDNDTGEISTIEDIEQNFMGQYFPVCYLFSINQVYQKDPKELTKQAKPTAQEEPVECIIL